MLAHRTRHGEVTGNRHVVERHGHRRVVGARPDLEDGRRRPSGDGLAEIAVDETRGPDH